LWRTYGVCFAEAARDDVLHVAVFTQLELSEVDLHLTVFDEHALLHHLRNTHTHTHTHTHTISTIQSELSQILVSEKSDGSGAGLC